MGREILWAIPPYFMLLTYGCFFISIVVFVGNLYHRIVFIAPRKSWSSLRDLFRGPLNWPLFWKTLFMQGKLQSKVARPKASFFHGLFFYSFLILLITTTLVAIHYETPWKIFQGKIYQTFSFLADAAGVFLMIGILIAGYRRRLKAQFWIFVLLFSLALGGFFLEAIRIHVTNSMISERWISPVGTFLASLLKMLLISEASWRFIYQMIWLLHMLSTMVLLAIIRKSKFFHWLLAPLNALITPIGQGAILRPMDFTNEAQESFGLASPSDLTPKQRLDLLACVECNHCTEVCPAFLAQRPLDPKLIITKLRDFNPVEPLYSANELDACTTCGACQSICPMSIEHLPLILEAKRFKALTLGDLPAQGVNVINKIKNHGNPWGLPAENRTVWANTLENVPFATPEKKVEYLYYVGCAGSYDPANMQITRDIVGLLQKANVSFAVLGKMEKCNGDPIRRMGDEYSFGEIAIENIKLINQFQFEKIIVQCPHCLHTIGKEYRYFDQGNFDVVHHTELLAQLLQEGKIIAKKPVTKKIVSFHDPCYLGRHHGQYTAPRQILTALPEINFQDIPESKEVAMCCGMGGGNMWYELPAGKSLGQQRLQHFSQQHTELVATSCSFCLINFQSQPTQSAKNMEVADVASILAQSVE